MREQHTKVQHEGLGEGAVTAVSQQCDHQPPCVAKILITIIQFSIDHAYLQHAVLLRGGEREVNVQSKYIMYTLI